MKRLVPLLACAALSLPSSAAPLDEDTSRLARQRGCALCHAFEPAKPRADGVPPSAPSWREIAGRYRGTAGAEDKLAAVVMRGTKTGERHWAGKAGIDEMPANPVGISEDEARKIVRWVLRLD